MKIIIADDEEYVRFELKELLLEIRIDLEITEAVNGSELIDKFKQGNFGAAFVDIKMPGFSGLEAIEKIVSRNLLTEWIILTGYSDFGYAKKAITLGVTEYLLKPVSRNELEDVLQKIDKNLARKSGKLNIDDSSDPNEKTIHLVRSAERIVCERFSEQIGVAQIADELGITPNYLSSLYRKFTNTTFTKHITDIRMVKALELLKRTGMSVKDATELLGYTSSRHFARLFREYYDISPSEYIGKCRK
ncbi:MAG: response regulator [Spirochaetales bacterium]|nr:response regulator [Spirochaetales bacterium]